MAHQITGEVSVDVDRTAAFAFLQHPQRLAACIPGCRDLRELSPMKYAAVVANRVAFMTVSFKVVIEIVKRDPPSAVEATITGDAVGLAGHVAATAGIQLVEDDEGKTTIRYVADIALTGTLGGLGQPVFRATSARLAREFDANLKQAIEATRTEAPV